jgi:hypothetical protein
VVRLGRRDGDDDLIIRERQVNGVAGQELDSLNVAGLLYPGKLLRCLTSSKGVLIKS